MTLTIKFQSGGDLMGEDLSFIYKMPIIFVFLCYITASGIFFFNRDELGELTKHYAEITAVTGGFTTSQYNDFKDDLKDIGLDPIETTIEIKATDPDGTDITSRALNVDAPNMTPYPTNPKYCPRGSKITITVISNKKSILANIFKSFGTQTNMSKASSKKVYMSERVK